MKKVVVCFCVILFPISAFSGITEDEMAHKELTFCYSVYTRKAYSTLVNQRDWEDVHRADAKLTAYSNSRYSPEDVKEMAINGAVQGVLLEPKASVPIGEVVNLCRRLIKSIDERY